MGRRLARKVLLVGWDAADWQIIHPLIDAGRMPNLARFIEDGAMGNLASLRPILSPMLWTSVATGKRPTSTASTVSPSRGPTGRAWAGRLHRSRANRSGAS